MSWPWVSWVFHSWLGFWMLLKHVETCWNHPMAMPCCK
jgi:hypothetical protein